MSRERARFLAGTVAFSGAISKYVLSPVQKHLSIVDVERTVWKCFCVKTIYHADVNGKYQVLQPCQMGLLASV